MIETVEGTMTLYQRCEVIIKKLEESVAACQAVRYLYLTWCRRVQFTMYMRPGIVLNVQVDDTDLDPEYIDNMFRAALVNKFWEGEDYA